MMQRRQSGDSVKGCTVCGAICCPTHVMLSGGKDRVVRSFMQGGWWLTDHPFLWNCVDDFGNCVPINPFTLVGWINDSHGLH